MNTDQKVGKVLGELESDVMEIIWQSTNSVSVREVAGYLQKRRKIAYTTVMTIMNRLVDKGLLSRRQNGRAYLYKGAVSRDKFLTRISRQIIKNFVASFGDAAVAHFVEEVGKLSPAKRAELRRLLKEAKKR